MKKDTANSATISSLGVLAAGIVFGVTFVSGGCTGSDPEKQDDRLPIPARVVTHE